MAEAFFSSLNQRLEPSVKTHLRNVYSCLAMSTVAAATGAYMFFRLAITFSPFLTLLANIGLVLTLMNTRGQEKAQTMRLGLLLALAFVNGYSLGPMLDFAIFIDPAILVTALSATAFIFTCFSLSALYANHHRYLYLGGTLGSFLMVLLLMSLANRFVQSLALYKFNLYLGLAIFCGYVCYDTKRIVAKRRGGDKDFIMHALLLFVNLFDIFIHILQILMLNEREKRRNERRRN